METYTAVDPTDAGNLGSDNNWLACIVNSYTKYTLIIAYTVQYEPTMYH